MTHPTPSQITNTVDAALAAFWNTVAQAFPEATTGDLDPSHTGGLERAAREAAEEWLAANLPAQPDRLLTVTFTMKTDATDEQITDMVTAAYVQFNEPADAEGDRADFDTRNVQTAWGTRIEVQA